jgi:hypothetical protein
LRGWPFRINLTPPRPKHLGVHAASERHVNMLRWRFAGELREPILLALAAAGRRYALSALGPFLRGARAIDLALGIVGGPYDDGDRARLMELVGDPEPGALLRLTPEILRCLREAFSEGARSDAERAWIERLAGEHAAATAELRESCDRGVETDEEDWEAAEERELLEARVEGLSEVLAAVGGPLGPR